MAKKQYDDDDGRTIVDMSGVTRPNLWSVRFPSSAPWHQDDAARKRRNKQAQEEAESGQAKANPYQSQLTKEDRRAYILVAVGSALGIAAVFGVVFAIAIILIGHAHC